MASRKTNIRRKDEHIDICLKETVEYSGVQTGLSDYCFIHQALPEIDFEDIDTSVEFLGKKLSMPLMISPITGGTKRLHGINTGLARIASDHGIAMGIGSLRIALEDSSLEKYFRIRKYAPDNLLFANLGAIQLNHGLGLKHCKRAVDIAEADGLILHLNPMQEIFQHEGDSDFSGLLRKIETICKGCDFPVIAKEVGFGISKDTAKKLISAGVSAIDIAGSGGTSWISIEAMRTGDPRMKRLAKEFMDWGIPTARSLDHLRGMKVRVPIIASGGIRNGLDLAKSIALGADIGGMALPVLRYLSESEEKASDYIDDIRQGLKISMFGIGTSDIDGLKNTKRIMRRD